MEAAARGRDSARGAAEGEMALRAHALEANYGSVTALERIDLEIPYGVSVAVLGPNGSGKSSLFAAAVGLLRPTSGSIATGGRGTAWLPQHLDVEPTFPVTVRDVVEMGRWGRRGWIRPVDAGDRRAVERALETLGIVDLADRRLHALSGGQRQRALLAQVMVQDAGLILLDEPLTGVDRPTADAIRGLIRRWRGEGRAVMVATHDLESAARDYDLVVALNRKLIAAGPPVEVCTEEVLRRTFSGHVAVLGDGEIVDTAHHHHGAS
jgi:ABC-type Mn2+/Zn2+ transport system ATPase subunit